MKAASFLVAALLVTAGSALAQTAPTVTGLGAEIGYFAPFTSGWDGGFAAQVNADLGVQRPFGVRLALGVASPKTGDEPFRASADLAYFTVGAIRVFQQQRSHPYVHADIGFYHFNRTNTINALGLEAGAGVEIPFAPRVTIAPELDAYLVSGDAPRFSIAALVGVHYRME
jgi:hypothetical protein